jgi:hypothetical protein
MFKRFSNFVSRFVGFLTLAVYYKVVGFGRAVMNLSGEYARIAQLIGNLALIPEVLKGLQELKEGVNPSSKWKRQFIEEIIMALDPIVQAAIDEVKAEAVKEAGEVKAKIDELAAKIASNTMTAQEIADAVLGLKGDVDNILPATSAA